MLRSQIVFITTIVFFTLSSLGSAANWPSWRGPTGNSICVEKDVPTRWTATDNVAWRVKLPGSGGATPVVWDDRIFVTSVDGNDLVVICFNTSGKQLWKRTVGTGDKRVRGDEGNAASPSPTTDGKHVWVMMANGAMACYDMAGKEIWKMNLQDRYGKFNIAFGMTSTPIVVGDRIYLQMIHGSMRNRTEEGLVAAMNALTGEPVWQKKRNTGAYKENKHSYASPTLYSDKKQKLFITHGADYTIAYALEDGKEIWRLGGLNPQDDPSTEYHTTLRFVASPTVNEGIVVIPTAKNRSVFAIRPTLRGDLTNSSEALVWKRAKDTPDVPSPLILDGLVYLCRENGNLLCVDAKTGDEIYYEKTHRTRHRASPVYADGHIYLSARDGRVTVVKAGRDFEIVSENEIGDSLSASPAIANGTIYLRSFGALWAIRDK